jgi:squalene synthase HpnC
LLAGQALPPQTLAQAYSHCRRIALGHYENFPVVSWLLPRELRPHIFAVYAYCRGVDELGDEAEGDRMALLNEWELELRRCYNGSPSDARFVALSDTIRRFDIPPEPFLRLIEANRRDQRTNRYRTFDELLDYCSYSANPVGRLVLYVVRYRDEAHGRLADNTCTALQLANFWQDVRRDLKMGRVYIPLEDMARFGYSEVDLAARRMTPEFRQLMRFEVKRTRDYFARGLPLVDRVGRRLRLDLRMFTLSGLAVLDEIERRRYDVLTRRPRVSGVRKAWLLVRGLAPVRMRAEEAR